MNWNNDELKKKKNRKTPTKSKQSLTLYHYKAYLLPVYDNLKKIEMLKKKKCGIKMWFRHTWGVAFNHSSNLFLSNDFGEWRSDHSSSKIFVYTKKEKEKLMEKNK